MKQIIRVLLAVAILASAPGTLPAQARNAPIEHELTLDPAPSIAKIAATPPTPYKTEPNSPNIPPTPPPPENLVLSVNVTPQGGTIQLGTRGMLEVPAGAVTQTVNVQATISQTVLLTSAVNAPVHLTFAPDVTFISPVTLTIDMNGLATPEAIAYFKYPLVLQWLNTSQNPAVWEEVTTSYNPATGILQAHITHFSDYQVNLATPPTPQAWKLSAAMANVALFRGAATHQYAIPLPANIDGLQPNLVAEYSSAGGDTQSDGQFVPGHHWSLGKGWDMQIPNISRLIKQNFVCDGDLTTGSSGEKKCATKNSQTWHFQVDPYDSYTLTFGGQSHILRLRSGNEYVTGSENEYMTESYTSLLIKRCTSATPCANPSITTTNSINEYWQVFTPDGALYTFGTDPSSTDTIYRPQDNTTYGRTWFVDKVYAVNRDDPSQNKWSMDYEYQGDVSGVTADFAVCTTNCQNDSSWYHPSTPDNWRRPQTIIYGNSAVSASLRYTTTFGYDWGARLGSVTVSSPAGAMSKVVFGRTQARNEIDSITQQSWDGSAWQSLPATSFVYTEVFSRLLVTSIGNGYGATQTIGYTRTNSGYSWFNPCCYNVVTQTITTDSATNWQRVDTYDYANSCYDATNVSGVTYPCYTSLRHPDNTFNSALVGYDTVTHTLRETIGGAAISIDAHRFYTDYMKAGKEFETRAYDGGNGLLQNSTTSYNTLTGGVLPANTWFAYPQNTTEYPLGDVAASGFTRQSQHMYITKTDSATGRFVILPERDVMTATATANGNTTSVYEYFPNFGKWIVNSPASKKVYGATAASGTPGNFLTEDVVYYDGATNYATAPTSGLVTKVESGDIANTSNGYTKQTASYNANGQPQTITDGRDNSSLAGYDPSGLFVTSVTNANGKVTSYAYYGVNGEAITNANGARQPYGALKKVTDDPNNAVTEYLYDVFGRLTAVAQPYDTTSSPTQAYTYTDGSPLKIVAAQKDGTSNGFSTYTFYDGLGRAIQTRAEENASQQRVVNTKYNAQGLAIQTTAPVLLSTASSLTSWAFTDPSTQTRYDALGRAVMITATDGLTTEHRYGTDNVTGAGYTPLYYFRHSVIDANKHVKQEITDAKGQLARVREFTGTYLSHVIYAETSYSYDALGNLAGVSDALGNTTVITYDALGRKGYMSDPDMGAWRYGYDGNGNLISQISPSGQITFTFDSLNRMKEKWGNGQKTAEYVYDETYYGSAIGRRTRTISYLNGASDNTTEDWFDNRGRVTQHRAVIDGSAYDTYYTYDSADRAITMKYPQTLEGQEIVTSTFTSAMQQQTIKGAYAYVTDSAYNAFGSLTKIAFGNNLNTLYRYWGLNYTDPNQSATYSYGQLRGICVTTSASCADGDNTSGVRMNIAYVHDAVGNITATGDRVRAERMNYSYDPLDRLTEWKQETPYNSNTYATQESYQYNAIGNITYKSDVGNYGYGAKPHAATSAGSNRYSYDPSGNMISRTEGGITYTQRFNIDNKFISVSGNNQAWRFVYNADGELAKRIDANGTTVFVGNYFERTDPSKRTGQVFVPSTQKSYGAYWKIEATTPSTTKYYFFGGQRVAMRVNDGAPTYLHSDNIGSTSLTTNNDGSLVSQTRYTPFGSIRPQSDTPPTNYTYQSHRSEGFGLSDFSARYYDPILGKFISADSVIPNPNDPRSFNRYMFVGNNPIRNTDPDGHCYPVCTALAGAAIGALLGGGIQVIQNAIAGNPLDTDLGNAVAVGAFAGAVGGVTFGVGAMAFGAGLGGTVASGAISGMVSGMAGRVADMALNDNDASKIGGTNEVLRDAALGGAFAGVGYGAGKIISQISTNNNALEAIVNRGFNGDDILYDAFIDGLPDGPASMRGSTVTGKSWATGRPFDARGVGTSDFDVALTSPSAMGSFAKEGKFPLGFNTKPLGDKMPNIAPSLSRSQISLQQMMGRPVNYQAMSRWFLVARSLRGESFFDLK